VTEAKLRTLRDAVTWRRTQRRPVVFTNGVFELLHPGHVALLEAARALGTALIVGVNDDRSAPRLGKGRGRPCVSAADRAHVLAGLAAVDCIVLFEEDTPAALVAALTPDVLVKGDDHDAATLPGRESVLTSGGRVVTLPRLAGYSTTSLMERIRATS